MELLYAYIESYSNIKNIEFNLGGQYSFHFERGKLDIYENPNYIKSFFSKGKKDTNIKNVTAIIGENGAGKSSVLNFLIDIMTLNYTKKGSYFAIFFDKENKIRIYNNGVHIIQPISLNYEISILETDRLIEKDIALTYYSTIFDGTPISYNPRLQDISTKYLFKDDNETYARETGYGLVDMLQIHHMKEIERQVKFISSEKLNHFNNMFSLPEELIVSFSLNTDSDNSIKQLDRFKISKHTKDVLAFIKDTEGKKYKSKEDLFIWSLTYRAIQHLIIEAEGTGLLLSDAGDISFVTYNKAKFPLDNVIIWLSKILRNVDGVTSNGGKNKAKDLVEGIIKTLVFVDNLIRTKKVSVEQDNFIISLNTGSYDLFRELMNRYKKTIGETAFLNFHWRNLSSGENAMLNLYARFYSLVESSKLSEKTQIILVDEGEVYFHPQWQKKFVNNLLSFLTDIFDTSEVESVQIIIASNSPFIVSDLPNSHIIFMKKSNNKSSVIIERLDNQHQTFAANIHTLLSNSFFLQDGLMGDFAKENINWAIRLLLNGSEEQVKESLPRIKYIIKNLGEPILKTKLTNMLNEREGTITSFIEKRIEYLETELANLKAGGKI